jgi:hypothetical protein
MILPARAHRRDTRRRAVDEANRLAHHMRHAGPPVRRTLLGPTEGRNNLLMLATGDVQHRTEAVHQRRPYAARADVNCKIEFRTHKSRASISQCRANDG